MIKDGAGHHPHSLRDPKPIADFIVRQPPAAGRQPRRTSSARTFTKSSFYGVESAYRDLPTEKTYVTCRGPWFTRVLRPLRIPA